LLISLNLLAHSFSIILKLIHQIFIGLLFVFLTVF
jgi:hypothetical protein